MVSSEANLFLCAFKVKVSLDGLMEMLAALFDIGDSVARVEQLLRELKSLEEKAQVRPGVTCP